MRSILDPSAPIARQISFTVPGKPTAKARPANRRGQYYKDGKTEAYEGLVRMSAVEALGGEHRFDGAVGMHIAVHLEPAASTPMSKRAKMLAGEIRANHRPDTDNVVKAILDGCNGVVFRDDVDVVELIATKSYAAVAGVTVSVFQLDGTGPGSG